MPDRVGEDSELYIFETKSFFSKKEKSYICGKHLYGNMTKQILTTFVSLTFCLTMSAWGGTEHRLMAYIAEEHLTESTRRFLDRYLDQSIVEYSTWMDRYRDSPGYEHTTYWHMVTMAADGTFPQDGEGKALQALNNAIGILRDHREHDDSTVFVNLLYVIHLVPEIHCPSHTYYYDLGGPAQAKARDFQRLTFDGKSTTYHGVWDSSVSTLNPGLTYDEYKEKFDTWTPEMQRSISDGTPEDWIRDNASICRRIYDWAKPGDSIGIEFLRKHREVPESMVPRAAYRLARVLNDLFDNQNQEE